MNKIKISSWILSILITLGIIGLLNFSGLIDNKALSENSSTDREYQKDDEPSEFTRSPKVPKRLYFCDEKVPLENVDVFERMERELIVNTYWHSSTFLFIKRANRWFPVIEEILKKNEVPEDFKYLALIESNLTNVVSPAGATGFWQFLKSTGKKYGLEINREIDERYYVEKSTWAACKYLKDAYKKYGNWTMAAASYNMGHNGTSRRMKKQKTNNYYNLVLPDETSRYIFRIIAAKEILTHQKKYGFNVKKSELYKPYKTYKVKINTQIKDFADWAEKQGINYKVLKMLNPWLRNSFLTNKKKKTYFIKLPKKGSINIIEEHK